MLNLLESSIKGSVDYTLCSKAYVFKTLMTFYDCALCDETTKVNNRLLSRCNGSTLVIAHLSSWIFFMFSVLQVKSPTYSCRCCSTSGFSCGYRKWSRPDWVSRTCNDLVILFSSRLLIVRMKHCLLCFSPWTISFRVWSQSTIEFNC
jgi:hypothetical protein